MEVARLLRQMARFQASDLHLKAGQPPVYRVRGQLVRAQVPPLDAAQCEALIRPLLNEDQNAELKRAGNVDFAWQDPDGPGRYRCNIYHQRGALSAAVRRVNTEIPTYQSLRLPPTMARLAQFEQGLVLIGGVTGSGKSTTLAAVLGDIIRTRRDHILTIEDPIEYIFEDDLAMINQREVGIDVADFDQALRSAVRQDPDVILIGEMRDGKTFETALTAAETGHLVFGTIHTSGAAQTIARILDLFPEEKHRQIRTSMAFNLRASINQKLVKSLNPEAPFVPVVESMFITPTVRKLLLDGEFHKLLDAIRAGGEHGCETYNQALLALFKTNVIDADTALRASSNPEELRMGLRGINITSSAIV